MVTKTRRTKPASDAPLWESSTGCAYGVRNSDGTVDVVVHSSNFVEHYTVLAGAKPDRAETVVRRLNAYPRGTRGSYGLL